MRSRRRARKSPRLPTHHAFTEAMWLTAFSVALFLAPGYLRMEGIPAMVAEGAGWLALFISTVRASAQLCGSLHLRSHRSLVLGFIALALAAAAHRVQGGIIESEAASTTLRGAVLVFAVTGAGLAANGLSLLLEPDPDAGRDRTLAETVERTKTTMKVALFMLLLLANILIAAARIALYLA